MIFKEMDPQEALKAIEGQPNILAKEVEEHKAYFSSLQCLYCGGGVHECLNPKELFTQESLLPKFLAECNDCGCQFEPYTGIEVRGPKKNPLED